MSEDLVNQLTLSYMISKQQLAKLNKRIKEDNETFRKSDKEIYKERLQLLFNELINNDKQDNIDVTEEVKYAFNFFIDKSIYYFKQKDKCEVLEKQRNEQTHTNANNNFDKNAELDDDLDLESDDKYDCYDEDYKSNDSLETDNSNDDSTNMNINLDKDIDMYKLDTKIVGSNKKYMEDMDTYPDIQPTLEETQNIVKRTNVTSKKKVKSEGVDNINDIQVNWFQNVQQQYKSNKIIPRKKDIIIAGHYHNK
jgi:hypothetical protein